MSDTRTKETLEVRGELLDLIDSLRQQLVGLEKDKAEPPSDSLRKLLEPVIEDSWRIEKLQQDMLAWFRKESIVFACPIVSDPKNRESVAMTIYTQLCEAAQISQDRIAALKELIGDLTKPIGQE